MDDSEIAALARAQGLDRLWADLPGEVRAAVVLAAAQREALAALQDEHEPS